MSATLKEKIMNEFGYKEECFSNYQSDLYILPHTHELGAVQDFIKALGWTYKSYISNVEGQDWCGHRFIEVPFAHNLVYH